MKNKIKNRKTKCHIRTCSGYPEKWIPAINARMTECEQGRSMVEMLGVLAVMGVLSVGGVAMYTNAMNKHKANEILNEASKRAVMVAAQAMTGKTGEISLSEFGSNTVSGVTFSKAEIKDNHIVLTLSGSGLADICAQLKNATGDNTVMKITKDDCSELTFNADMSVGSSSGTGNESGTTTPACDPACSGGKECVNGTCECPDDEPIWNVSEQKCEMKEICGTKEIFENSNSVGFDSYYVPALNICQPELWCEDAYANIDSDTYTCLCPKYAQKLGTGTAIGFECVDGCSYGEPENGVCPCRVYDTDGGCTPCTGGQQGYNNNDSGTSWPICQCATGYHFDYDDAKDCVPDE